MIKPAWLLIYKYIYSSLNIELACITLSCPLFSSLVAEMEMEFIKVSSDGHSIILVERTDQRMHMHVRVDSTN